MSTRRLPEITPEEFEALMRKAVRQELDAAGLRIDEPEARHEAREDFRFLRRMRNVVDGAAAKVGSIILITLAGGFIWLVTQGFNVWKGH
jgi:hypothetical protein